MGLIRKLFVYIALLSLILNSCSSIHRIHRNTLNYNSSATYTKKVITDELLETAHSFLGTPYRFGGTSHDGMDCSGLVWNVYKSVNVVLPRISRDQANAGKNVKINNVIPGDALFFNTSGRGISHVGLVDHISNGEVFFIHASSSHGVTISSLNQSYWHKRLVKAVRYL